jgi:hypothetical protein
MADRGYLDEPIEIAPDKFKEFRDCTTAEADAAVALILQRRIDQLVAEELAAGRSPEFGWVARQAAQLMSERERSIVAIVGIQKMLEKARQAKGGDA